jgi:excisionase family DNA binding protein
MPARRRPIAPVLLRVPEAADALGVSRATVYNLLAAGTLRSVKIGGSRRIAQAELDRIARGEPAPA